MEQIPVPPGVLLRSMIQRGPLDRLNSVTANRMKQRRCPISQVRPAYFFRQKFTYSGDKAFVDHLVGRVLRDDAAAIYLNGEEVFRDTSLPQNPPFDFYCVTPTPSETAFASFNIPASKLLVGENTIAVEVHQATSGSSDVSFNFELSTFVRPGSRAMVTILNDDFDLDGMSDTWERANGLNYGSAADATQDIDSDGVINRLEFLALTDPRNIASLLDSGTPNLSAGNTLSLTFSGLSTLRSYQLDSSPNLTLWGAADQHSVVRDRHRRGQPGAHAAVAGRAVRRRSRGRARPRGGRGGARHQRPGELRRGGRLPACRSATALFDSTYCVAVLQHIRDVGAAVARAGPRHPAGRPPADRRAGQRGALLVQLAAERHGSLRDGAAFLHRPGRWRAASRPPRRPARSCPACCASTASTRCRCSSFR